MGEIVSANYGKLTAGWGLVKATLDHLGIAAKSVETEVHLALGDACPLLPRPDASLYSSS
jgi:hypothetical protein